MQPFCINYRLFIKPSLIKMRNTILIISAILMLAFASCSTVRNQNKGNVVPANFEYETTFETSKSLIILPFEIDGVSKNFLFDTGADYSLIQRDTMVGSKAKVSGASSRKVELGNEIVKSMKFGPVDFVNTIALNGDMKGLAEQIPNFGGLLGQPIIKKANWLIDYPNKTVKISSGKLDDESFQSIRIKTIDGAPYTFINIDGVAQKVIIDMGSSSEFNLPKEHKLAKALIQKLKFEENERERYTLGGMQKTKEKVGFVPIIKLGNMEFKNIKTTINNSSQPRIGIGFFKDCIIYIDNSNKGYRIKKLEN